MSTTKHFSSADNITTPFVAKNTTHVYHQYTLKLTGVDREELMQHLAHNGIPSNIYYPLANHKQEAFTADFGNTSLPITEQLSKEVLSLPIHTELSQEQINHITSHILKF